MEFPNTWQLASAQFYCQHALESDQDCSYNSGSCQTVAQFVFVAFVDTVASASAAFVAFAAFVASCQE